MAQAVLASAKAGLAGFEWGIGVPGTIGGSVRGNAGCFGGEIKDVVESVDSINLATLKDVRRTAPECGFSYRSSVFKENGGKEVIVSVVLKLNKGNGDEIKKAINEKIIYRTMRHPLEYPNIGSIFKNVRLTSVQRSQLPRVLSVVKHDPFSVVPTAYLIAQTGLKGVASGGAMVSPKHPNFIVNVLDATAEDVRSLISLVKTEVKREFEIDLEQEVQSV